MKKDIYDNPQSPTKEEILYESISANQLTFGDRCWYPPRKGRLVYKKVSFYEQRVTLENGEYKTDYYKVQISKNVYFFRKRAEGDR